MVTKLRSFSTNAAVKIMAFILIVICITTVVAQIQYTAFKSFNPESLFVKQYKDSEDFISNYVTDALSRTVSLIHSGNGQEELSQNKDFYYFITDGSKTYSNSPTTDRSFFQQYDSAFYAFEKGRWSLGSNTNPKTTLSFFGVENKYTVYIAFTNEFLKQKQMEWQTSREKLSAITAYMTAFVVLGLLLIIFLICTAGRRPDDKKVHLSKTDSIYSDILLFSFMPLAIIWIRGVSNVNFSGGYESGNFGINQIYSMIYVGIFTAAIAAICGMILLSLVRKIKAGKLLKQSLVFMVYDFFKSLFDGRIFSKYPLTKSLFYRQLVFICASAVMVLLTLLFVNDRVPMVQVPPVIEIAMIYWYIKGNSKTYEAINKGFNESLEDQMRAERMKIALVTNVSHDLKTPLTSIISYVDLLSKEEDLSDTARDYVKILSEKSNRLKNIVSDLFDLAKSTSGNITLDQESIDIKKLIEQTLADMTDEVVKSGLQIKTKLPDKPVNIVSDGKKLYRVFQNIIDNALKYSLKGSRIFVELEENNGKAVATIKNTAGYEMDFTAEEILQRFNRGDKSRTTEGSGLGLSIAESFTKVCGGSFNVSIDGDLFKTTISFNID